MDQSIQHNKALLNFCNDKDVVQRFISRLQLYSFSTFFLWLGCIQRRRKFSAEDRKNNFEITSIPGISGRKERRQELINSLNSKSRMRQLFQAHKRIINWFSRFFSTLHSDIHLPNQDFLGMTNAPGTCTFCLIVHGKHLFFRSPPLPASSCQPTWTLSRPYLLGFSGKCTS